MDVEQVIDELYGAAPEEFVAARDARSAEARSSKDTSAAKRIAALRRPTLAAWASNRFVRERPEDVRRLLTLGETLQEATRLLDATKLREAAGVQNKVIAAEVREAAAVADEAGHPLSASVRQEVEQLFRAVLADPEIAAEWSTGRLVKPPEAPVGFGTITPESLPPRAAPRRKPEPDDGARAAARKAEKEAEEAAAEAGARDEELHAAEARASEADALVADLEERLSQAKAERRTARAAAKEASKAAREAHRRAEGLRTEAGGD
ncbi:hypothetical protein M5362_00620 [Streptomyces sp. Je 1-79]|uniref:hypothetical protein n=1 Tax=Streptomyces sp. Je 1-79 TaxID=2943847 RepID=UPI0021A47159|nr:hypothetical protein [Streptomyces sp. Je 1-79]MCT4351634.1 hypothetical protein [Streptomyces sp. Je 1-79]